MQGDKLADDMLMIGIALTILPVIIILSIWSAIGVEFHAYSIQNNVSPYHNDSIIILMRLIIMFVLVMQNLQIVNYTTCFREISEIFDFVMNGYILILFIFLFILSLLTASVPSSTFRREGVVTYKATAFVLLPTPFVFLTRVTVILSHKPEQFEVLFWVEFCWNAVLPLILLAVLFAPTVSSYIQL